VITGTGLSSKTGLGSHRELKDSFGDKIVSGCLGLMATCMMDCKRKQEDTDAAAFTLLDRPS
jgi:hypothetical protein